MGKVRSITVNFNSGSAAYLRDLDKVKAKTREFGQSGVSEAKAVHAALKDLEGGWQSNSRAAAAFAESILGLGPLAKAAFPVIGALSFIAVIDEAGKKTYEFFKELREGPERVSAAFRSLNSGLRLTN